MKTQGVEEPVGRCSGLGARGREPLGGASRTEEGEGGPWRKAGMGLTRTSRPAAGASPEGKRKLGEQGRCPGVASESVVSRKEFFCGGPSCVAMGDTQPSTTV